MSYKNDGYITTISGARYYFTHPAPEMIEFEDIQWGLANQCRFVGQIIPGKFYSVAEHSFHVSKMVERMGGNAMAALFHDAFEAYGGDVSSPLKELLNPNYTTLERMGLAAIMVKFDLQVSVEDWQKIRKADRALLDLEGSLLTVAPHWLEDLDREAVQHINLAYLEPRSAAELFRSRYMDLKERMVIA